MNVWFCIFMGKFLSNRWESRLEGVENRATPQQTPVLKLSIFQQGPFTLGWHPSQQPPPPEKSSNEPVAPLDQWPLLQDAKQANIGVMSSSLDHDI